MAVVGLWPKNRGVIVVKSSMKSTRMFTYASLCCSALSHIEGTSPFLPSYSYLAEYVMFYSPGLSLSILVPLMYLFILSFSSFRMYLENTNWNSMSIAVVRLVMREVKSTIDKSSCPYSFLSLFQLKFLFHNFWLLSLGF